MKKEKIEFSILSSPAKRKPGVGHQAPRLLVVLLLLLLLSIELGAIGNTFALYLTLLCVFMVYLGGEFFRIVAV